MCAHNEEFLREERTYHNGREKTNRGLEGPVSSTSHPNHMRFEKWRQAVSVHYVLAFARLTLIKEDKRLAKDIMETDGPRGP